MRYGWAYNVVCSSGAMHSRCRDKTVGSRGDPLSSPRLSATAAADTGGPEPGVLSPQADLQVWIPSGLVEPGSKCYPLRSSWPPCRCSCVRTRQSRRSASRRPRDGSPSPSPVWQRPRCHDRLFGPQADRRITTTPTEGERRPMTVTRNRDVHGAPSAGTRTRPPLSRPIPRPSTVANEVAFSRCLSDCG
jgi:hypothetical protein